MANPSPELLHGTLDALVLKTLAGGRRHGYAIARAIEETTAEVVAVEEGSLYPALQRMLVKGWVAGEWSTTTENRRARYYHLTALGRKQLQIELTQFARIVGAITRVIQAT
jgi:PadR family transcriptional regulator PadR